MQPIRQSPSPAPVLLSVEEARDQILARVPRLGIETVPLQDAPARILGGDMRSAVDLPPFDNSAMDGYAVRSADVVAAREANPVGLRQIACIPAGSQSGAPVLPGQCTRIFTGSPLPGGTDAVVMQEDVRLDPANPGTVLVLDRVGCGENVRLRGSDVRSGELVAGAGQRLGTALLGLLGAIGCGAVPVHRRPLAGLVATGDELTEAGPTLREGQIYESNRVMLGAMCAQAGAQVMSFPLVADRLESTRAALEAAFARCDVVVSTGGVSVGDLDYVKPAFQALGGELHLWRISMKPGKPVAFGTLDGKLLFGLPGNPVSAFVTFLLLVRPALLAFQGARALTLPSRAATLAEPFSNRGNRRHFCRVTVDSEGRVASAGLQGSHHLSSLARATGLIDVPPETTLLAGAQVQVLGWD